jgi:hypothetical protein
MASSGWRASSTVSILPAILREIESKVLDMKKADNPESQFLSISFLDYPLRGESL